MNKRNLFLSLLITLNAYSQIELETLLVTGEQESYFEETTTSMKGKLENKEIPYTVTVTKEQLIEDIKAQRIEDTYDYTTGLTKVGKNADAINIRGFETSLENIHVDGMSGLISRMGSPTTANIDRIEVIKGPASVLYGAMQPGGFINLQTKLPQAQSSVSVETTLQTYASGVSKFGSDNGLTTTIDATGPISENLFYRFIAVGEKLDSYRDDVDFTNLYIYPSLLWNVDDNTSLLLSMEYGKEEGSADDGLFVANHDIATAASINTVYQESSDYDNDEGTALSAKLEHYISDDVIYNFSWRSVFHNDERKLYENRKVNEATNVEDTTLTRRNRHQYNERDWHSFDNNLNYGTTIANLDNNITLGLAGNYRDTDYDRLIMGGNVADNTYIYSPVYGSTATATENNKRRTVYYNSAVYLQDKINLADDLTLVAATRFDRSKVDFYCLRGSCVEDNTKYSSDFVSSLGMIYNVNYIVSLYGSVAQSYDPSTAERVDENGSGLDSETSKQFEIGTKLNFSEKLNSTLSVYKIYKENVAESNGDYYELTGEVEGKGFEAELQWLVEDNWQVKTGYAFNSSEYVEGSSEGLRPANNPKNTAYVFTRYNIPQKINDGLLGLTGGIVYRDEIYTSSDIDARVKLPSYTRYDVGLNYDLKDWKFALTVENITDKVYYESGTDNYKIYSGEPRKLTLSLKRTF